MRKLKLLEQTNLIAFANAIGGGAPFANAIESQDSGGVVWAGEESTGGVAFVVIGKDQARAPSGLETLVESAPHVEFVF